MSLQKEARSPHGSPLPAAPQLRITSYRRTVHIHRRPDVHSLELQEEASGRGLCRSMVIFFTVPRFSAPATFTRTGYSGRCHFSL